MTEQDKYRLSLYTTVAVLRATEHGKVELVESSLDGMRYIKKIYPSDKRDVFRVLAEIKNPHIPEIKEIFFGTDTVIVEQYVAGETVEQYLEQHRGFKKAEVKRIFEDLLDAVDVLHKNNIVHRDIKPGNIIIRPDGRAVLLDYGIARLYTKKQTTDTERLGTVGYAAPEQFGFAQSDFRTDLYGLGRTMEKLFTVSEVPGSVAGAVAQCVKFDPDRRFQSVEEIRRYFLRKKRSWVVLSALCMLVLTVIIGCLMPKPASALVYGPDPERIVNIYEAGMEVPCLPMPADGRYQASVPLNEDGKKTRITAERNGDTCRITVDGTTFSFEDDHSLSKADYPSGTTHMEILFYDMNEDGILDILPIIANAAKVQWQDGTVNLLKNYTLAWCIWYDGRDFRRCDTRMECVLERFCVFQAPGCLWTDFPYYYKLEAGEIVRLR